MQQEAVQARLLLDALAGVDQQQARPRRSRRPVIMFLMNSRWPGASMMT